MGRGGAIDGRCTSSARVRALTNLSCIVVFLVCVLAPGYVSSTGKKPVPPSKDSLVVFVCQRREL